MFVACKIKSIYFLLIENYTTGISIEEQSKNLNYEIAMFNKINRRMKYLHGVFHLTIKKYYKQMKTKNFMSMPAVILLSILNFFNSGTALAQDKEIDVNINTDGGGGAWYTAWWVWVIGLAVFVIILVAIISAGKRK